MLGDLLELLSCFTLDVASGPQYYVISFEVLPLWRCGITGLLVHRRLSIHLSSLQSN